MLAFPKMSLITEVLLPDGSTTTTGATNQTSTTIDLTANANGGPHTHIDVVKMLAAAYDRYYSLADSLFRGQFDGDSLTAGVTLDGGKQYRVDSMPSIGFATGDPLAGIQQGCLLSAYNPSQTLVGQWFLPYSQLRMFNPTSIRGIVVFPAS